MLMKNDAEIGAKRRSLRMNYRPVFVEGEPDRLFHGPKRGWLIVLSTIGSTHSTSAES